MAILHTRCGNNQVHKSMPIFLAQNLVIYKATISLSPAFANRILWNFPHPIRL